MNSVGRSLVVSVRTRLLLDGGVGQSGRALSDDNSTISTRWPVTRDWSVGRLETQTKWELGFLLAADTSSSPPWVHRSCGGAATACHEEAREECPNDAFHFAPVIQSLRR
jgi:hypothetical protein